MSGLQLAIAHAVKLAVLAALVGSFVRGHHRRCWTFTVYLGAIVCCNTLVTTWPDAFRTEGFWMLKQAAYDVLKFLVALELGYRAVRAFPGAARGARVAAAFALVASIVVILSGPVHMPYRAVFQWQPQILAASVWVLALTALLAVWYHLPLSSWHRAIVLGFAPYLLVFTVVLNLLKHHGWALGQVAGVIDSLAYLAVVTWWAWAAWQPHGVPVITEEDLKQLASDTIAGPA